MRALTAVFILAYLLAGCASHPPAAHPPPGESAFTLDGRIAVKWDGQHSSGGFHWLHDGASDDITLLAPLGITAAHIKRDTQGASLETSGKLYTAADSSELMLRALGWSLPLDGLPYWVMAKPMPGTQATLERDANGQLSVLRQDGWDIRYTAYAAADGLPTRMTLQHDKLEIRLVVDEWNAK